MKTLRFSLLVGLGSLMLAAPHLALPGSFRQLGIAKSSALQQWGSGPAGMVPNIPQGAVIEGPCGATTLRFTEVPFRAVHGLRVRGAQFRFTIGGGPSMDASYNASGPGQGVFVQDPSLEGNAFGTLEIEFAALTPFLSFGLARNTVASLTPGATVLLIDTNGNLIGSFPVNTAVQMAGLFSEGQFTYNNPGAPVRRAIIIFQLADVAPRFALDNLNYRAYDISLEDETTGDVFQFNSQSGDYQFIHCADGSSVFGTGGAAGFGCTLSFGAGGGRKGGAAQVQASVNTCAGTGSATIRLLPAGATFTVSDNNIEDNDCTCGGGDK